MVNYSKWDQIGADDEDEDEAAADAVARRRADFAKAADVHKQSMALMAGYMQEAWPPFSDEEVAHVLAFVSAQHRGIYADNIKRATEIVGFVEAKKAPGARPLHALALLAQQRASEPADAVQKEQARRVFDVALCALNTVAACDAAGGARALFDELVREPKGERATRYSAFKFAFERLQEPPPDPHAPEPTEPPPTTWRSFAKALLIQLCLSLLVTGVVMALATASGPRLTPEALARAAELRAASAAADAPPVQTDVFADEGTHQEL